MSHIIEWIYRYPYATVAIAVLLEQLGVPLPAAAAAREVLSAVKGVTTEDVDFSALATFWKHAR